MCIRDRQNGWRKFTPSTYSIHCLDSRTSPSRSSGYAFSICFSVLMTRDDVDGGSFTFTFTPASVAAAWSTASQILRRAAGCAWSLQYDGGAGAFLGLCAVRSSVDWKRLLARRRKEGRFVLALFAVVALLRAERDIAVSVVAERVMIGREKTGVPSRGWISLGAAGVVVAAARRKVGFGAARRESSS